MKFILTAANTSPSVKYSLTNKSKMRKGENTKDFVKRVLGDRWVPLGVDFNKKNEIMVVPLFFGKKKDGRYAKNSKIQIARQLKILESQGWVKETIVRTIILDYSKNLGTLNRPHIFNPDEAARFSDSAKKGFIRGELGTPKREKTETEAAFVGRYSSISEKNTVINIHSAVFNEFHNTVTLQYSVIHTLANKKRLEKQIDKGLLRPGLRAWSSTSHPTQPVFINKIITFDLIETPELQKANSVLD